jgi:hypothetical protein
MIRRIFGAVADALEAVGGLTGLNYNEVNVLLYYLVVPMSWGVMLDVWLLKPIFGPTVLLIWIGILFAVRRNFSSWCDRVFDVSVDFLNWFNQFGSNYVLNSVIICVLVPLAIYSLLTWLLVKG